MNVIEPLEVEEKVNEKQNASKKQPSRKRILKIKKTTALQ